MDELDELMPRRRIDYTRLGIQLLDLLAVVIFLISVSFEDRVLQLALMGLAALFGWIATWLSIRYRAKARNPMVVLISLVISLVVALIITIIFIYSYAVSGGLTGLM